MSYKKNATEFVYNFICSKIQNNEWKPSEKIWTEKKFTDELDVSRTAVRQAIDKLVAVSVLKKIQGSGTYVEKNQSVFITSSAPHPITDTGLLDICRFRIFFEPGNTEMFIQNASQKDHDNLKSIHEALLRCDKHSDIFSQLDFDFHRAIAYGTGNSFIIEIYSFLHSFLSSNQKRLHQILGPEIALKYHPLIIEYIEKGDAPAASLMMRRHMEEVADILEDKFN